MGKVAIITGASRGIGLETALLFARQGCTHIAITYQSATSLAQAALASIATMDPSITTTTIQADVRDPDFGTHVVSCALTQLNVSQIDILVSNAGLQDIDDHKLAANITKADFDLAMTAQAWAPLQLSIAAIAHMPRGGRVILNSSGSSKGAYGDPYVMHCASKAAMDSIARNLAIAYGPAKGITVNSIGAGATDTDSLRKAMEVNGGAPVKKMMEELSPLKRLGEAKEVASIIAFVASPEASWINGTFLAQGLHSAASPRGLNADTRWCYRQPGSCQRWHDVGLARVDRSWKHCGYAS